MAQRPCLWLLSAYRSESHAAWADWLCETFKEYHWQRLELPGRHFRWRIRGNPLSWLNQLPENTPQLIIATSMVDLATLRGLHPRLAHVPCIYYFHENQFAYPRSKEQHNSIDPQMVQLYGALTADILCFNSAYNRDSFFSGIDQLLARLPDAVPENVTQRLRQKSQVLPVAIAEPLPEHSHKDESLILWNHRWEYDKAPEIFLAALQKLADKTRNFQLALLGQRATPKPETLHRIEQQFNSQIVVNGCIPRDDYRQWLNRSTIVVSTARHEFQGLSMLEAVAAGACPLVPDALCYPEQYAKNYRYPATDAGALADKLYQQLQSTCDAPDVTAWYGSALQAKWQECIETNRQLTG